MKRRNLFITLLLAGTLLVGSTMTTLAAPTPWDSKGVVEFTADDGKKDIDDPEIPGKVVDPDEEEDGEEITGMTGSLTLDYVSLLDFGQHKVSTDDQVYSVAKKTGTNREDGSTTEFPNFLQVTDARGDDIGWKLNVVQTKPFTLTAESNSKHGGHKLEGAVIEFTDVEINSEVDDTAMWPQNVVTNFQLGYDVEKDESIGSVDVVKAEEGTGLGKYSVRFGSTQKTDGIDDPDDETAEDAVTLFVPGNKTKYLGIYKATLTWTLSNTPD